MNQTVYIVNPFLNPNRIEAEIVNLYFYKFSLPCHPIGGCNVSYEAPFAKWPQF